MKASQRNKLLALAEDPSTAPQLLREMDKRPRIASALWDIYCAALLTVGGSAS